MIGVYQQQRQRFTIHGAAHRLPFKHIVEPSSIVRSGRFVDGSLPRILLLQAIALGHLSIATSEPIGKGEQKITGDAR